ncbi:MAG TPA: DUF268 domain-containing protein [bacterium]|nr:DUF268 domain-containing protein [bacterium]
MRVNRITRLYKRWLVPIWDPVKTFGAIPQYSRYAGDWIRYARSPGSEPLRLAEGYPCLSDRTAQTPFDPHYFYQAVWAMDRISTCGGRRHVDIGSDVLFVGMLSPRIPVTFIDIRPVDARLPRLTCVEASILALPLRDRSVVSLSCLHVAEHIGLGRYGDPLNPFGTRIACAELMRVLAPDANLFFSAPVGRARVCFNAHRIHTPAQIIEYFDALSLVEFSAVDDDGRFVTHADPGAVAQAAYACGLFWFRRARP